MEGHREAFYQRRLDHLDAIIASVHPSTSTGSPYSEVPSTGSDSTSLESSSSPSQRSSTFSTAAGHQQQDAASLSSCTSIGTCFTLPSRTQTASQQPPAPSEFQAMLDFLAARHRASAADPLELSQDSGLLRRHFSNPPPDEDNSTSTSSTPGHSPDHLLTAPAQLFLPQPQGIAVSPAIHMEAMARIAREAEEDISIPESMPSFASAEMPAVTSQHSFQLADSSVEESESYALHTQSDGELAGSFSSVEAPGVGVFEGDTVASTISSLTSIQVRRLSVFCANQMEGFIIAIPFQEQDDPPDLGDGGAASLESNNELEPTGDV